MYVAILFSSATSLEILYYLSYMYQTYWLTIFNLKFSKPDIGLPVKLNFKRRNFANQGSFT